MSVYLTFMSTYLFVGNVSVTTTSVNSGVKNYDMTRGNLTCLTLTERDLVVVDRPLQNLPTLHRETRYEYTY